MATGHLHSVILDDDRYHHLFNLMFLNSDEIDVIRLSLSGKPIPQDKLHAINNLRKSVDEIINMAVVKNTQPQSERLSIEEIRGEEIKEVNEEVDEEKEDKNDKQ